MACWQTVDFWIGLGSGIVLSFLFWLCLFVTYQEGKKAATEKPEVEDEE